jgi:hypothetical protein
VLQNENSASASEIQLVRFKIMGYCGTSFLQERLVQREMDSMTFCGYAIDITDITRLQVAFDTNPKE